MLRTARRRSHLGLCPAQNRSYMDDRFSLQGQAPTWVLCRALAELVAGGMQLAAFFTLASYFWLDGWWAGQASKTLPNTHGCPYEAMPLTEWQSLVRE